MTGATVRIRLDLAYDGTEFHGWAVQPGLRTVAGVLAGALARLCGEGGFSDLTVAGRTDSGVHATGQVAHLDLHRTELAASMVRRLAGVLPPDIRVTAATPVAPEFHARFSALSRRYEYRLTDAPYGALPLRRREVVAWPRQLDLAAMNAAAAGLVGEHDFAAYCRHNPNRTTVREVRQLQWRREPDGILVATAVADAFCHSMVRSLVGAMIAVGEGRQKPEWPAGLLTQRERSGAVRVAPAHGLTLVAVDYPATATQWAARAQATRRVRSPAAGTAPAES